MLAILDGAGYDALLNGDTFADGFDYFQPARPRENRYLAEYLVLNPGCGRVWPDYCRRSAPGNLRRLRDGHAGRDVDGPAAAAGLAALCRLPPTCSAARGIAAICASWLPAGVTKWSAVRRLATQWGIADSEICAVGDDVNDIPMIRSAGLGVAMGNAVPEVKVAADRIAPTHDHDGLVEVVGWLFE